MKQWKNLLGVLCGVFLVVCFSTAGHASLINVNLINNGSFETYTGSLDTWRVAADSTAITDWTVGSIGNIDRLGTYFGYTDPADGAWYLDLSGNAAGSISQTFDTIAGATYKVLFDMAGNVDGGSTVKGLQVTVGSTSQNFSFDTTGYTDTDLGWTTNEFDFTGTGEKTTLTFASLENNAYGAFLDNVSMTDDPPPNNVPEPATLLLLGSSLIGLAVVGKKKLFRKTN